MHKERLSQVVSQPHKISNSKTARSWWIVFRDAEDPWIKRFTRKGFGHCYAFTHMNNLVMGIEPMKGTVNHLITDSAFANMLAAQRERGYTVVHFRWPSDPHKWLARSPVMNCASYLAYTMGFSFMGITPYQLYKKLMRLGGEEL